MISSEPKEKQTKTVRTKVEILYENEFGNQTLPVGTIGFICDKGSTNKITVLFYPSNHTVNWPQDRLDLICEVISSSDPSVPDWGSRIVASLIKQLLKDNKPDQASGVFIKQKLYEDIIRTSAWLEIGVGIRSILFESGEKTDNGLELSREDANRLIDIVGFTEKFKLSDPELSFKR